MYADLYDHVGFRMEGKGHVDKVASLQGPHAKEPRGLMCKWKIDQSSMQRHCSDSRVALIQTLLWTWFCQVLHVQESQFWSELHDYPHFLSVAVGYSHSSKSSRQLSCLIHSREQGKE